MQRMFFRILLTAVLATSFVYAQSLGDIARENQAKKAAETSSATPPKVITNKDLPKSPDAGQGPSQSPPAPAIEANRQAADHDAQTRGAQQRADQRAVQQRLAERRATDQWKRQILAQQTTMANLQARIDQLHASIQAQNGSVQSEGPFNRYQARQLQQVGQIQRRLDEQRAKLDQMQDAARHAGMNSAVYDP